MLARHKLLGWLHQVPPVTPASSSGGPKVLALLVAWYVIVHFLLVTGGWMYRTFKESWKGILVLLRRIPSVRAKISESSAHVLEEKVPTLFDLAWDACVIFFVV